MERTGGMADVDEGTRGIMMLMGVFLGGFFLGGGFNVIDEDHDYAPFYEIKMDGWMEGSDGYMRETLAELGRMGKKTLIPRGGGREG